MSTTWVEADGGSMPGAGPAGRALAVVICRAGEPPPGADEAVCEAGGGVLLVGERTRQALGRLTCARRAWLWETAPGLRPGALSRELAALLVDCALVVLPGSADGRDLAPRLAAELDRSLLAGATRVAVTAGPRGEEVSGVLSRLDGRLEVPVRCPAPAVATLLPGAGSAVAAVPELVLTPAPGSGSALVSAPAAVPAPVFGPDVEVLEVLEPDPSTMDLADATRVLAAGAGLIRPGTGEVAGTAVFDLLVGVASALRASAGATRVVTDAGWAGVERQIGTTGVSVEPQLYLAFGISGATQHIGGIGAPAQVISVNTDASCPMTAMATLGLVADAPAVLRELAARLGVAVPDPAREVLGTADRLPGTGSGVASENTEVTA